MKKTITRYITTGSIALMSLSFAATALAGTWTAPTGTPPNNNVDAPINVGTAAQNKNGALGVAGFANFGVSDLFQKVTVGCVVSPCPLTTGGTPTLFEVGNGYSVFNNTVRLLGGGTRLGVGTSSPDSQIHVHSANSTAGITISTGTTNWMKLYQPYNSGDIRIGQGTSSSVTDLVTFKATGNVGIGLTNPSQKLQVAGAILSGNDGAAIRGSVSNGIVYLGDTAQYIRSVYGGGLRLGTAGAQDAITIKEGNGYVGIGIGKTNPQERLDVDGNIVANGTVKGKVLQAIDPSSNKTIFTLYIDQCAGDGHLTYYSTCNFPKNSNTYPNVKLGIYAQAQ